MNDRDVEIVAADTVTWDTLAQALNRGYIDYFEPVCTTARQLRRMAIIWDVDPGGSVIALAASGEPVGIGLLALRGRRAWVGGLAVVPEWRRRGLGRVMLGRLVEGARQRGAAHVTLEVLIENKPAIALYRSVGFHVQREILVWERHPEEGALPVPASRAERVDVAALVGDFDAWHAERPCWQRETRSLRPLLRHLDGWALLEGGRPTAYALTFEQGNQLTLVDVGIAPQAEVRAVARPLLQSLQLLHMDHTLILRDLPAGDPLNRVLAALGFRVDRRQYEMRLEIE